MSIVLSDEVADEFTLQVMYKLISLYEKDAKAHYQYVSQHKGGKALSRFNFYPLSKKVFDDIPAEKLPLLYITLFHQCDYVAIERGASNISIPDYPQALCNLRELIVNVVVVYQLPRSVKREGVKKDGKDEKKSKKNFVQIPPRCTFTVEEAKELFKRFLHLHLVTDRNHWKQMRYILMPDRNPSDYAVLGPIARHAIDIGDISFAALSFLMQDPVINQYFGPEVILHALYIGPLKGSTVELFAANRDPEFRRRCRELIAIADRAQLSEYEHAQCRPRNIMPEFYMIWTYKEFCETTPLLINDLRGVRKQFVPISANWAYAAIKKFGRRAYVDKTWSEECYYDLIWTVLAQRAHMKKSICETLEKDFRDYGAARYWRKMQPNQMNRIFIRNRNETRLTSLMEYSPEFLNFPAYVKDILMVRSTAELIQVRGKISAELYRQGTCFLGLDAEWTAFTGESKASILQVALQDVIYIIDIDWLEETQELKEFFHYMFKHPQILKIGFQFAEDLTQMRAAVHHCRALFEPENVVCVGRMFADLLEATEKREDGQEILAEICPNLSNEKFNKESLNEKENGAEENGRRRDEDGGQERRRDEDEGQEGRSDEDGGRPAAAENSRETVFQRTMNRGLSHLCEQVLGRPLDKREQCSVWDRRPLRALQMRYAAMDAYCLLMLFDVCNKWSMRLGTPIDELIARQPPMRCSLPLFSDE